MRANVVVVLTLLVGCGAPGTRDSSPARSGSGDSRGGQAFVDAHNRARSRLGLPKLSWSADMAQRAQRAAAACTGDHSNTTFGENIYGKTEKPSPEEAVNAWVKEGADYDHGRNTCRAGRMCGHYTQVMWRSTQRVGCATQTCGRWTYVYCAYDPPGNWRGEKPY